MNWLARLLWAFQATPFLQGGVAALGTLVLEDPAVLASGLLVAQGAMGFKAAFLGLTLGIAGGDLGLYLTGRAARNRLHRWKWTGSPRMARVKAWFQRHGLATVLISRFVPGMRLPTYLAAGAFGVPLGGFLGTVILASVIWTYLLLTLSVRLGQAAFARAGALRLPVGFGILAFVLLLQWAIERRVRQDPAPRVRSAYEFWPPFLFYPPVLLYSLWLALRHRGLTLPTLANPSIYSGGLIMESKGDILGLVPPAQQEWIAPWIRVEAPGRGAAAALRSAVLDFPVVAKPDVGQRGAGVRPVRDEAELQDYLSRSPEGEQVILQRLVPFDHEAGILYYRMPGEEEGHIFSITLKEFPEVAGDGTRTLRELILADPRARLMRKVYFQRHALALGRVLPEGEGFRLVFAGNHCQGAIFRDGAKILTPDLARRIHAIAASLPGFHFGRFDLRFSSLEELQRGEGFQIVEINGAGAEATHIWDPDGRLFEAYRTLFHQFRILFAIGAANRERGHRPLGIGRILRDVLLYQRRARAYPTTR